MNIFIFVLFILKLAILGGPLLLFYYIRVNMAVSVIMVNKNYKAESSNFFVIVLKDPMVLAVLALWVSIVFQDLTPE